MPVSPYKKMPYLTYRPSSPASHSAHIFSLPSRWGTSHPFIRLDDADLSYRNGTTNFYAPKPQIVSLYPIPPGSTMQDSPFRPLGSSTNSFASEIYKKENNIGINYREVTRTPSPTPSETVALSGRTRTFNFKKYFDPGFWKDRRNVSACALIISSWIPA